MSTTEILRWLAETSLAASLLIIVILLIRRPIAKAFGAEAAYALWFAPLIRIFLPEFSILRAPTEVVPVQLEWAREGAGVTMPVTPAIDFLALAAGSALLIWIMVAVAWVFVKLEKQSRFLRTVYASSMPAPASLQHEATAVAKQFGVKRAFQLRLSDNEYGPSICGLTRPVICLPASFECTYSDRERRLALGHELAHMKRGDVTAAFLAILFQAAQWPNPIVHLAMRAFRSDQEAACDAFVLRKQRKNKHATSDYASAILKSARHSADDAVFGLYLGHPVKERLMLLKNKNRSTLRRFAGGIAVVAITAAGLAGTASYGFAADDEKQKVKIIEKRDVIVLSDDDDGEINRRVMVFSGDGGEVADVMMLGDHDFAFMEGGEGPHFRKFPGDTSASAYFMGDCSTTDGDGEPAKLEWKEEAGEGDEKTISHTVICLNGDEASGDPKERAKALRKAIDRMEENAKKEEARRKKMIEALRKQLRALEKKK